MSSIEDDVLRRYSTPRLRRCELDRHAKKEQLQGKGVKPDEVELIIARLYDSSKDITNR